MGPPSPPFFVFLPWIHVTLSKSSSSGRLLRFFIWMSEGETEQYMFCTVTGKWENFRGRDFRYIFRGTGKIFLREGVWDGELSRLGRLHSRQCRPWSTPWNLIISAIIALNVWEREDSHKSLGNREVWESGSGILRMDQDQWVTVPLCRG